MPTTPSSRASTSDKKAQGTASAADTAPGAGSRVGEEEEPEERWAFGKATSFDPVAVRSLDELLTRGIGDYIFQPVPALGKGKFSAVYLAGKGPKTYAIKHTPLYPHHPLIATRLMREPTLLAQLPPHPNLIAVYETITTPGHCYVVEDFLDGYITLETLVTMHTRTGRLEPPIARLVLDQLVSVVRDALHHPIAICHRDIKSENILVHPETLHLVLLDFGLSSHFSRSEAKLTTCCGSPAYHAPEIVLALAHPPGAIKYWGPEIDIWTIGVTLLRCLTGRRYPLGVSHGSVEAMAHRVKTSLTEVSRAEGMRAAVAGLLDIDGRTRRRFFELWEVCEEVERERGAWAGVRKEFKGTSFIPSDAKYTLPLPLITTSLSPPTPPPDRSAPVSPLYTPLFEYPPPIFPSPKTTAAPLPTLPTPIPTAPALHLLNPTRQPPARILSFLKYALRCHGILYHVLPHSLGRPTADTEMTLQCVVALPAEDPRRPPLNTSLTSTLMSRLRPCARSSSTPAVPRANPLAAKSAPPDRSPGPKTTRALMFYIGVVIPHESRTSKKSTTRSRPAFERSTSRQNARSASRAAKRASTSSTQTASTSSHEHPSPFSTPLIQPAELQPLPESAPSSPRVGRPRRGTGTLTVSPPQRITVYVSDVRALETVREAFSIGGPRGPDAGVNQQAGGGGATASAPEDEERGRPRARFSAKEKERADAEAAATASPKRSSVVGGFFEAIGVSLGLGGRGDGGGRSGSATSKLAAQDEEDDVLYPSRLSASVASSGRRASSTPPPSTVNQLRSEG